MQISCLQRSRRWWGQDVLLGRLRRGTVRKTVVLPLLLALALRAAIPAGFMLGPDAQGHLALVLCPGAGPMPAHQHHHHHGGPQSTHEPDSLCPFAASAGAAPLPTIAAVPLTTSDRIIVAVVERTSSTVSTILRVQQARGPPVAV